MMLSRNDPASGMRVFASAKAADMHIERGVFTRGRDPFSYLRPLGAHLFLSANEVDVRRALSIGFPAARVMVDSTPAGDRYPQEVRIEIGRDTSELQSQSNLVCRLLLEKKKKKKDIARHVTAKESMATKAHHCMVHH